VRLVRAERVYDGDRLAIVAGERGAVELRHYPNFSCFYVHSPDGPEALGRRAVAATVRRRGRQASVPGLARHRCHILEGDCWAGLVPCGSYDFDAPDVDEVIQWEALEELYEFHLGGGGRGR
jgi:hypothetical protein